MARGHLVGLSEVERQARPQTASELCLNGVMADASLDGSLHVQVDEGTHTRLTRQTTRLGRRSSSTTGPARTTIPPFRASVTLRR